ncbi:MAG: hypothetical protein A2845_00310 [Candidatus Lloydbacteria bacterium RIFCSPHIGHO2_01_FULL_49_22]|uniref:CheC-like protein domain-containing protein n=1 Tax=Candidatus Lloydbacteria bacterium RIFCSPHIGHO2_01_FULL_49_22 TaxID=1798658 RepID=A0A1G2CXY9_9BACT|nr:MAG: hypothetical protein A2845_00310 [Candidatus Lloydbacteria bacterium RIFCSPHIGHO2_01_FULL_49_22]OGZ09307.1 MAG: hypothetical protein A3C14_05215 [Candidatus Lloydbacteria bacterium RIFCSPHIGHO2_02_FULL_50_18]
MPSLFQLTENDNDQLRELVNIGVSHAGDTLSLMMGKHITVSIPGISVQSASTTLCLPQGDEDLTVSVLLRVYGLINGYVFLFFPRTAALRLLQVLSGKSISDVRALDRFDRSIFQELGNVITGGTLNGLSKFLHIEMLHSVPNVVVDMSGAIFNSLSASMVKQHEEFLSLDVSICIDSPSSSAVCVDSEASAARMYLFMGPDAVERILAITNAMIGKKNDL